MAIIDVVKWNATDQQYAWKFPSQELSTWTQLIVSESQEAVVLMNGEMAGPFGPGRHVLDTQNVPILTSLLKIPFGGKSPYSAEVWFIQKTMPLDVKWGTPDPIQVLDPQFNILVPVRAFGQLGLQIVDTKKFLLKLVGTMPSFSRDQMTSYFRGVTLTRVKTSVAEIIIKNKVSVLEIAALLDKVSAQLKENLNDEFVEFGIRLINFYVSSINVPEDNPAIIDLRKALSKRAEMGIIGFNYQQERSFDVLQEAAGNPGSMAGGVMGAGMGLGMGVAMGSPMGTAMGQLAGQLNPGPPTGPNEKCPQCNQPLLNGVKFCGECGALIKRCAKCGKMIPPESAGCPNCHAETVKCTSCNIENEPGAKFCRECGTALWKSCCGKQLSASTKFCPECGKPVK